MDEVTKQFYREVETFAPRNHKNGFDWKILAGHDFDANIPSNYFTAKGLIDQHDDRSTYRRKEEK